MRLRNDEAEESHSTGEIQDMNSNIDAIPSGFSEVGSPTWKSNANSQPYTIYIT